MDVLSLQFDDAIASDGGGQWRYDASTFFAGVIAFGSDGKRVDVGA